MILVGKCITSDETKGRKNRDGVFYFRIRFLGLEATGNSCVWGCELPKLDGESKEQQWNIIKNQILKGEKSPQCFQNKTNSIQQTSPDRETLTGRVRPQKAESRGVAYSSTEFLTCCKEGFSSNSSFMIPGVVKRWHQAFLRGARWQQSGNGYTLQRGMFHLGNPKSRVFCTPGMHGFSQGEWGKRRESSRLLSDTGSAQFSALPISPKCFWPGFISHRCLSCAIAWKIQLQLSKNKKGFYVLNQRKSWNIVGMMWTESQEASARWERFY